MERDKRLEELIKEHGIVNAPDGFSEKVMDKIEELPIAKKYKPIIHPGIIFSFVALFIVAIVILSQTAINLPEEAVLSLPVWDLSFPDISSLVSTGLTAGIIGIFFLLLAEFSFRRRKV